MITRGTYVLDEEIEKMFRVVSEMCNRPNNQRDIQNYLALIRVEIENSKMPFDVPSQVPIIHECSNNGFFSEWKGTIPSKPEKCADYPDPSINL